MKTYYTRGLELISLERTGATRYYVFDGHGSTRLLADETGAVTDTYTYDAFGNLTDKTGTTENSYLYCGEQFEGTTGLYYLRARYMNPQTGTFISMDSYQGSIYDPVSLHKYLYANANPVMFTDPSGYFSLAETSVGQAISNILDKIDSSPYIKIGLNILNTLSTIYDTVNQVVEVLDNGGSILDIAAALINGVITSIFLNKMCSIKIIGAILTPILIGVGLISQAEAIADAVKEERWDLVVTRSIQLAISILSLGQSCFTRDTPVATENGHKRIDEIEVGDKVWAYNIETGETELKEVTKVYIHNVYEILHLHTTAGNIDTTTNHPFYVIEKGWVAAGDLKVEDEVYSLDGTTSVVIGSELEKLDNPIKVYNLEVDDFHTYFVGDMPVLVHNYKAESGNEYPENQDYSYKDPNSDDYLNIHNNHDHEGIQPHTQYPNANRAPDGTIYYNAGGCSPTTNGDYELLDFAINILGWIRDPKGGR